MSVKCKCPALLTWMAQLRNDMGNETRVTVTEVQNPQLKSHKTYNIKQHYNKKKKRCNFRYVTSKEKLFALKPCYNKDTH